MLSENICNISSLSHSVLPVSECNCCGFIQAEKWKHLVKCNYHITSEESQPCALQLCFTGCVWLNSLGWSCSFLQERLFGIKRVCRGRGKLGKISVLSLLQDTEMLHFVQVKPLWQICRGLGRTEIKVFLWQLPKIMVPADEEKEHCFTGRNSDWLIYLLWAGKAQTKFLCQFNNVFLRICFETDIQGTKTLCKYCVLTKMYHEYWYLSLFVGFWRHLCNYTNYFFFSYDMHWLYPKVIKWLYLTNVFCKVSQEIVTEFCNSYFSLK